MSKDSIIRFRVSSYDKDNAQELIEKLGYKNLSTFFRDYLDSLLELNHKNFSELELLEQYYNQMLNDPNTNSYKKFSLKSKLNLINEFKNIIDKEVL